MPEGLWKKISPAAWNRATRKPLPHGEDSKALPPDNSNQNHQETMRRHRPSRRIFIVLALTILSACQTGDHASIQPHQYPQNGQAGFRAYRWVTGYCACEVCCGKYADGMTASGRPPIQGRTVAANFAPFGSILTIDGLKNSFVVEDRMNRKYSQRVDIYFQNHDEALRWGKQKRLVTSFRK